MTAILRWMMFTLVSCFYYEKFGSDAAGIDHEVLPGTHGAVVGGEEQHHGRYVVRHEEPRQTLGALDFGLACIVDPQIDLALGHHPARRDRVDADAVRAEVARQAAREADHGCLGRAIDGIAAIHGVVRHRTDVDDRTGAAPLHAR